MLLNKTFILGPCGSGHWGLSELCLSCLCQGQNHPACKPILSPHSWHIASFCSQARAESFARPNPQPSTSNRSKLQSLKDNTEVVALHTLPYSHPKGLQFPYEKV